MLEQPIEATLATLEKLLRQYDHIGEANLAEWVGCQWKQDPQTACRLLDSADWWDGEESIAAIDLSIDGGFTHQAREDAQVLRFSLMELVDWMKSNGVENPQAELVVSQFNKWLASSI